MKKFCIVVVCALSLAAYADEELMRNWVVLVPCGARTVRATPG
ncbi:MAG: hypothetical protein ACYTBW_07600 [Planctomycetota bacterium]